MKRYLPLMVAAVFASLSASNVFAVAFSVNFTNSDFSVTGTAGAVPLGNWNNVTSKSGIDPMSSDGATLTGISFTADSGGISLNDDSHFTPASGQDYNLLKAGRGNEKNHDLDISGLSSHFGNPYDVLVYVMAYANGNAQFVLEETGDVRTYGMRNGTGSSDFDGTYVEITSTSGVGDRGQYIRFNGLTADTFTLNGSRNGGDGRQTILGFQVVEQVSQETAVPEPASAGLALLSLVGLTGMLSRRRRA